MHGAAVQALAGTPPKPLAIGLPLRRGLNGAANGNCVCFVLVPFAP